MPAREACETATVETWVRRDLARRYDAVLREDIPESLLRLCRGDRD